MRAIGIVLAGGNSAGMGVLAEKRAVAAMPVAGSYRAIDFALSNMSNSHVQKVAVCTQFNSRSLNQHLNSSKWWGFGRKQGGLFVLTPTITMENDSWYRGTADAMYQNMDFLKESHEPYVIITSGDCVYKLDYDKMLEYHIEKKSDITVAYTTLPAGRDDLHRFGILAMDEEGRIREFDEKPDVIETSNVNTGIYIIRRRLLIELLEKRIEALETDSHQPDTLQDYLDQAGIPLKTCTEIPYFPGFLIHTKDGEPLLVEMNKPLKRIESYTAGDKKKFKCDVTYHSPTWKEMDGRSGLLTIRNGKLTLTAAEFRHPVYAEDLP